jgi:hypothetical protein
VPVDWLEVASYPQGGSMKVFILLAALVLIAIPVSPQITPRGVELSVDHADAYTYRRARVTTRRVVRRTYRRNYYYH